MTVRKKRPAGGRALNHENHDASHRKTNPPLLSGVNFSALRDVLPLEVREARAYVLWRLEEEKKVPYYGNGRRRQGTNGSTEDRRGLVALDQAEYAYRRDGFDGIGLALLPELGITALDFDDCRTEDGTLTGAVLRFMDESYAEISPSGTGE